jgi:WD40 repeat protein
MGGNREALIIATGIHEDQALRRLRAPAQDAAALARVLSDPTIGQFHVQQVVDQPAHRVNRSIQQFFANRSLDDLLLVHLSCHGVKDDDGRLYFAATDTEKDLLASTAVSAHFLNDLMQRCRARSIVLLLDCCYSGAFLSGSKGDEGVHLKEKFFGRGRAILTASNAIEYAWEGDELSGEGQPSLFTSAIVNGLQTGEADQDRDGAVSINDLYAHVCEQVLAAKRGQTPLMWALEIERNLYIARNPHPLAMQPVELPPELQQALEHPLASVRAAIIDDLGPLLRSNDLGRSLAAREALKRLCEDDSRRVSAAARAILDSHQPDSTSETTQLEVPESRGSTVSAAAPTGAPVVAGADLAHEFAATGWSSKHVRTFLHPSRSGQQTSESVNAVAFSPDGDRLASASEDMTARIWKISSGEQLQTITHDGFVQVVAFSPDGGWLATSTGGTTQLWDTDTGEELHILPSTLGPPLTVSPTGDDKRWRPPTTLDIAQAYTGDVWSVAFGPDGHWLATCTSDGTTRIWDTGSGKPRQTHTRDVSPVHVAFSPDARWLATTSFDATLIWETSSDEQLQTITHDVLVRVVAFSPDGHWLATCTLDATTWIWDTNNGEQLHTLTHEHGVEAVAFSPDGRWLATSSVHATRIWETSSGKQLHALAHDNLGVRAVAFSPDARLLAAATFRDGVVVWELTPPSRQ